MKIFVLLHNQIMMAQATILNSPEQWFPTEVEEVVYQLRLMVLNFHASGDLTDYQTVKLISLVEAIPSYNTNK